MNLANVEIGAEINMQRTFMDKFLSITQILADNVIPESSLAKIGDPDCDKVVGEPFLGT